MTLPDDRNARIGAASLWDEQRVESWRHAYAQHPVQVGLWDQEHLSRGIDHGSVRGHSAYIFQDRMDGESVERSYRQLTARHPRLASVLTEDGAFGAVTHKVQGNAVSRDLLDSIAEIGFLAEHFDLSLGGGILDVGAGYGRLAHRLSESFPAIRVACADEIPESSALCEAYLQHRRVRADVLGRFQVAQYLARVPVRMASAIHSFPEMSLPAIEQWLTLLSQGGIDYLFLVPNEIGDLRASDRDDAARLSFVHVLSDWGYERICRRLKYHGEGEFVYQDEFLLYATRSGKERAFAHTTDQSADQQACEACGLAAIPLIADDEQRVAKEPYPVA